MMQDVSDVQPPDGCDNKFKNVYPEGWSERQRRFLEAYQERPVVSSAARLASVHRATIYRWLAVDGFAKAMRTAANEYFRKHREKVMADQADRQSWRAARERARWPMRCENLAIARAAKHR